MKKLMYMLVFLLPVFAKAQKVTVEKDTIRVDGAAYAIIEKDKCGIFDAECRFTVKNLAGKPALIIRIASMEGAVPRTASNQKGLVTYSDFNFLASKQKGQIEDYYMKTDKMAKYIVKNKLFVNGDIDNEAAENFVLVNPVVYGGKVDRVIITN